MITPVNYDGDLDDCHEINDGGICIHCGGKFGPLTEVKFSSEKYEGGGIKISDQTLIAVERERLLAMLKEFEWTEEDSGEIYCLSCDGYKLRIDYDIVDPKPVKIAGAHAEDCEMKYFIHLLEKR